MFFTLAMLFTTNYDMDLVNQNIHENLTEPLIYFNTMDGSNHPVAITGDETEESCHIVSLFIQN